jgi:RHS repeat-associated protein
MYNLLIIKPLKSLWTQFLPIYSYSFLNFKLRYSCFPLRFKWGGWEGRKQGFLYAPFGELMYEHDPLWQNNRVPKYSFNAKELDEENGMYYYSARYYAPPTFISRDPMFEKYPSISPYTYCANNPMKFVDPTGKAIKDPPWKNIPSVIKESDFVGWQSGSNCFNLGQQQMGKANTVATDVVYQLYTENKGANKQDVPKAIEYIQNTLEQGNPVFIGVENQKGHPGNNDKTTDHFIVIVGMGNDKKGNYFQFYDNATKSKSSGTSSENKLYFNEDEGLIQGHSQTEYGRSYSDPNLGNKAPYTDGYIITQVRKTETENIE